MTVNCECFRPQGSAQCFKTTGPRVLVISLFDGASAVMCAVMRLPCAVQGFASAGGDSVENRLSRTRFPGMIELGKPADIDAPTVSKLVASIGYRLDFVLLAGCLPYQETLGGDNMSTNRLATRSPLDIITVTDLYKMVTEPFAVPVHMMLESLAELPVSSISALSELCASSLTWSMPSPSLGCGGRGFSGSRGMSRPCLVKGLRAVACTFSARGARHAWVDSGCCWEGCPSDSLPVFTRPRPRTTAPTTAVDLSTLPTEAVVRWREDMHRFDVSCYLSQHMVTTSEGLLRLPTLRERERLVGFLTTTSLRVFIRN